MIELFCRQNGYKFGSVLKIGSGEAILSTPFKIFAILKIKKLANSISVQKYKSMEVTMPITKRMFIKASTAYWLRYGAKNGCTKEEMDTMMIESRTMWQRGIQSNLERGFIDFILYPSYGFNIFKVDAGVLWRFIWTIVTKPPHQGECLGAGALSMYSYYEFYYCCGNKLYLYIGFHDFIDFLQRVC